MILKTHTKTYLLTMTTTTTIRMLIIPLRCTNTRVLTYDNDYAPDTFSERLGLIMIIARAARNRPHLPRRVFSLCLFDFFFLRKNTKKSHKPRETSFRNSNNV